MFHSGLSWSCVFILAFYVDMKELVLGSIRQAPMWTEKSVVSAKASLPSYSRKEATPLFCWSSTLFLHQHLLCVERHLSVPTSWLGPYTTGMSPSSVWLNSTSFQLLFASRASALCLIFSVVAVLFPCSLVPATWGSCSWVAAFPVHLQNTMVSLWKCRLFPAVFRHPETGLSLARAGILRPEARLQRLPLHLIQHLLS